MDSKQLTSGSRTKIARFLARAMRKTLFLTHKFSTHFHNWSTRTFARFVDRHRWAFLSADFDESTDPSHSSVLKRYYNHLRSITETMPFQPTISVLVPVYKVQTVFLRQALGSIAAQTYQKWELCIVDDASGDPNITALIDEFAQRFPGKVKSSINPKNSNISVTSNNALAMASGEYVALLDHDDLLYPNALGEVVRHINLYDQPDVLYSDEITVDPTGVPVNGVFHKPNWSPLFHLSVNYTTHLSIYRTALVRQLGGFRVGFEGSQDHDLMLRVVEKTQKPVVHIPMCLYQWRAHEQSTAGNPDSKPYAATAGVKAVTEACARRGYPAEVTFEPETLHYRVKFYLPEIKPLISIVIPTKNRLELIRTCVESIKSKTTYRPFEIIIVDNGTSDVECLTYLESLQTKSSVTDSPNISIIRDDGPFNFARLNNRAVAQSKGEYIVLLNNDTEVITPEWLEEMLRIAQIKNVGAVGAKLLFPDNTVQHVGVMLSGRMIATHYFHRLKDNHNVYLNYMQTMHETAVSTAACLMIEKEKFLKVGGLDEIFVPNGFGDVDFGIKLLREGWSTVYTPYAKLYHHESPSRGLNVEVFEQLVLLKKYPDYLMRDPIRSFCQLADAYLPVDPVRLIPELGPAEMQSFIRKAFPEGGRK